MLFFEADLGTPRQHIRVGRTEGEPVHLLVAPLPLDDAFGNAELGILRHINEVSVAPVGGVALGVDLDTITEPVHRFGELDLLGEDGAAGEELLPEHIGGKGERASGMLFFAEAVEIGRVTDLRFDFFLAIPVVIVGNDGQHHAAVIAASYLESTAVIVELIRIAPADTVEPLALGSLTVVREAEIHLTEADQMRGKDDAAGVPGPVVNVKGGIAFRKMRVAAVAEDGFDKIQ